MEKNKLNFILFIINVVIFISYFAVSHFYIKGVMTEHLDLIEKSVVEEDWEKAEKISKDIEDNWRKNKFFIMCNYGESEFDGFEGYINDITGGVRSQDLPTSLTTILSAKDAWINLNKIIPMP